MRILIATMNEGKLREYERLLAGVSGLELETMASLAEPVEVVEDRDTFVGNALKKAAEIAKVAGIACPEVVWTAGSRCFDLGRPPLEGMWV